MSGRGGAQSGHAVCRRRPHSRFSRGRRGDGTRVRAVSRLDALGMAAEVRGRRVTARELVAATLERIRGRDAELNCFTAVVAESAMREAEAVDADMGAGKAVGPLAGVPFAVKNLFDVAGLTTLAGSRINAERPRAVTDATVVARLRGAGAALGGALNMDEYAFGFTTENTHYGPTHNPHDPARVAGGAAGGSRRPGGGRRPPFPPAPAPKNLPPPPPPPPGPVSPQPPPPPPSPAP